MPLSGPVAVVFAVIVFIVVVLAMVVLVVVVLVVVVLFLIFLVVIFLVVNFLAVIFLFLSCTQDCQPVKLYMPLWQLGRNQGCRIAEPQTKFGKQPLKSATREGIKEEAM